MAKQQQRLVTTTATTIRDGYGQIIVEIGYTDTRILYPGVGVESMRNSDTLTTSCGVVWAPVQLMAKPPRYIGICDQCRNPPFRAWGGRRATHGIVLISNATTCEAGCGTLCCPKHRSMCSDDKWRCLACAKKSWWREWVNCFFWRRVR